jgi:hypothetical protein
MSKTSKLETLTRTTNRLQQQVNELRHKLGEVCPFPTRPDRFAVEVLTENSLKVLPAANWDDADQRALKAFFDDHRAVVTVHDRLHATSHRATLSISYKERPPLK